jgi:hypothetical protein
MKEVARSFRPFPQNDSRGAVDVGHVFASIAHQDRLGRPVAPRNARRQAATLIAHACNYVFHRHWRGAPRLGGQRPRVGPTHHLLLVHQRDTRHRHDQHDRADGDARGQMHPEQHLPHAMCPPIAAKDCDTRQSTGQPPDDPATPPIPSERRRPNRRARSVRILIPVSRNCRMALSTCVPKDCPPDRRDGFPAKDGTGSHRADRRPVPGTPLAELAVLFPLIRLAADLDADPHGNSPWLVCLPMASDSHLNGAQRLHPVLPPESPPKAHCDA